MNLGAAAVTFACRGHMGESRPMKHRKLRIAWSVAWGALAALLIVLWVRSYWRTTYIVGQISSSLYFQVSLQPGTFGLLTSSESGVAPWTVSHVSSEEWMRDFEKQKAVGGYISGTHWSPVWGTFFFQNEKNVPFWFLLGVVAAMSGVSWFRWRFTLRTLLIATTLVAAGLGLIMWAGK
jgi:hypothetical protein